MLKWHYSGTGLAALLGSLLACANLGCASTKRSTPVEAPEIITRQQWQSAQIDSGYRPHTVRRVTIHHSGGKVYTGERAPGQYLRDLQAWSRRDRPWVDIPYHYMIDLKGRIYEARPVQYAGDTNTAYDPSGHALISLMGNYNEQPLLPAQREAVVRLAAWLCQTYNVSPDSIRGHRDYVEGTDCPGKNVYPLLRGGDIVTEVKARLRGKK